MTVTPRGGDWQKELAAYNQERNEVLLAGDLQRFLEWSAKCNVHMTAPTGLIAMHKARTAVVALPMAERSISKKWLLERGYSSFDDGDAP